MSSRPLLLNPCVRRISWCSLLQCKYQVLWVTVLQKICRSLGKSRSEFRAWTIVLLLVPFFTVHHWQTIRSLSLWSESLRSMTRSSNTGSASTFLTSQSTFTSQVKTDDESVSLRSECLIDRNLSNLSLKSSSTMTDTGSASARTSTFFTSQSAFASQVKTDVLLESPDDINYSVRYFLQSTYSPFY